MAQPHERVYRGIKQIILHNFIGGIAWGLGATIGLAVVLTILGFIIRNADVVPFVGDFIVDVNEYIINKQPEIVQ